LKLDLFSEPGEFDAISRQRDFDGVRGFVLVVGAGTEEAGTLFVEVVHTLAKGHGARPKWASEEAQMAPCPDVCM
jgi:hypothetical protein